MIDYARITVKAGDGGHGAGSFRHIKGKRFGKADGGDGGSGGNVYIETSPHFSTLDKYRFVKDYKAQNGQNGSSNLRRGADGEDLILKVPVGTVVKVKSQSQKSQESLYTSHFDLVTEVQRVLLARGGQGGRGNAKLRDEFGRRPKHGEAGNQGELCQVTLELKLIADVGLVGLPNAGKSTLLATLTAARPEIAPYPFTTLEPNLGVLFPAGPVVGSSRPTSSINSSSNVGSNSLVDLRALDGTPSAHATRLVKTLILADIPGLIEGASQGKGLGDLFLRHIERTKILIHLIDVSTESDKWQDYQQIRNELKLYSRELSKKKEIIVLSKIDLVASAKIAKAKTEFAKHRKKPIAISAQNKIGLDLLLKEIRRKLKY